MRSIEEFKKVLDNLLENSIEEIILHAGLEKYEVLKLAKERVYVIDYQGYLYKNDVEYK